MPTNPVRAIVCNTANKHLVVTIQRPEPVEGRTYTNPTPASRRRINKLTDAIEPEVKDRTFTYHMPQQYDHIPDFNLAIV